MANGGESFLNMMSEDNDVEDFSLPMPVENRSIPTTAAKGGSGRKNHIPTKRTFNFVCHGTTLALIRLLAMSSQEMPIGKELLSTIMPNRNFESDHSANSLEHRWGTIQKEMTLFQACYEHIERLHPSGVPYQEHVSNTSSCSFVAILVKM